MFWKENAFIGKPYDNSTFSVVITKNSSQTSFSLFSVSSPLYVCMLVTQSLSLCDPMEYSLPSLSVHGILQVRRLEWVTIPFSRVSSQPRGQILVSHIEGRFTWIWATMAQPPELSLVWATGEAPLLCSRPKN